MLHPQLEKINKNNINEVIESILLFKDNKGEYIFKNVENPKERINNIIMRLFKDKM